MSETALDYTAADLPADFYDQVARRRNLAEQAKKLKEAIEEIDNFITVHLKVNDLKSVRVGDIGTLGLRTNTSTRIDPSLLLKQGVRVAQIEAATVRTESKEFVQLYPKNKKRTDVETED